MEDIEVCFNEAADFIASRSQGQGSSSSVPNDKLLLQLYGYYKVATIGPCNEQQPSIFNMKGRTKWGAWKEVSSLNKQNAMEHYVDLVKSSFGWKPQVHEGDTELLNKDNEEQFGKVNKPPPTTSGSSLLMMGNAVSSFAIPVEDLVNEDKDDHPVFAWAKDADLEKLMDWIRNNGSEINMTDSNGLSILHWAVDRGHRGACELLLGAGANPNVTDNDGLTPLDYAITCEYEEIIVMIKQGILKNSKI